MNNQQISLISNGKFRDFDAVFAEMGLDGAEVICRQLLRGKPLGIESLSLLINKSLEETNAMVTSHGEVNLHGEVVGFMGITLVETNHKLLVDERVIFTWCAADTLLFPKFLGFSANIESKDPISGEVVKLSVYEDHLEWTNPVPLYISLMEKADSCDIRNSFCNHSHFFANDKTARKWLEENPSGRISLVDDFFTFSSKCCC